MANVIQNRYDFVLLFDVKDGNPNGDPDAGNLPRVDPETGNGLVTDVCLKRKVRNYVQLAKGNAQGYAIFIKEKAILNNLIAEAHKRDEVKTKAKGEKTDAARAFMCSEYFDVRTFGAVMSTGENAGQVRGPVQLTFARSIDPVVSAEHSITRMAVTTPAEAEKQQGDNRTMGRKFTIPYGLYLSHGFISPSLAAQTGFSKDDLDLLKKALKNMFEADRSAARGEMCLPYPIVAFRHESPLGDAPAHELFARLSITRRDLTRPARDFSDYAVTLNKDNLPKGVTIELW